MSDIEIINIFYTNKGRINPHLTNEIWLNEHIDIYNYLNNRYSDSLSIQETLYRIKNNIEKRPVCPVCGNQLSFLGGSKGFREVCSVKCSKNYIKSNIIDIYDKNIILNDIIENNKLNNNKLQDKYLKDHGYYKFIESIYPDSINRSEKIYRLYYNIENVPTCIECGKKVEFINFDKGYSLFCLGTCNKKHNIKNIQITDDLIIKLLFENNNPIFNRFIKKYLQNFHIYDYIINRYKDSSNISEIIYRIKNNIINKPCCIICKQPCKFISYKDGYSKTCSQSCQYKLSSSIENSIDNINDNYIKQKYSNSTQIKKIQLMQDGTYTYLKNRFNNTSIYETIYRIINDINEVPKCKICGKPLTFININKGYKNYCSQYCTIRNKTINYYRDLGYNINIEQNNIKIFNGCNIHKDIILNKNVFYRRLNNNEVLCPICNTHKLTSLETAISNILDKYNIKYYYHDRKHIYPLELDLFLPDYNIGIECNGIYWHSDNKIENNQHIIKYNKCKENNIQLITFWEDDIINNIYKIEGILLSILGLNKRIYARNCIIKEIDSKTSKDFIDKNHLQGNISAAIKLGLFYNDELVEVMTFGKTRKPLGGKQEEYIYELYRLCSKIGFTIIGGASKLLSYFKTNYKWKTIISYCENDISNGNVYEKIGFTFTKDCGISYWYYDKNMNRINRYSLRKDKVDDGSGRTADEIVKSLGYRKCYNSGNKKYILENNNFI